MEACDLKQGSDEWFNFRLGKVSASRISDVMAKTKSGYSASRSNYMSQLICERLTENREDNYVNTAMQRGIDLESKARDIYILKSFDCEVKEVGAVAHPNIKYAIASPDGLVNDDGLIEIKCPNTATHINFLETSKPKQEYIYQMMWQMICTGRKWCDFVSYDDRLPDNLSFKCVRIYYDEELAEKIIIEVKKFLAELDKRIEKLTAQ